MQVLSPLIGEQQLNVSLGAETTAIVSSVSFQKHQI